MDSGCSLLEAEPSDKDETDWVWSLVAGSFPLLRSPFSTLSSDSSLALALNVILNRPVFVFEATPRASREIYNSFTILVLTNRLIPRFLVPTALGNLARPARHPHSRLPVETKTKPVWARLPELYERSCRLERWFIVTGLIAYLSL